MGDEKIRLKEKSTQYNRFVPLFDNRTESLIPMELLEEECPIWPWIEASSGIVLTYILVHVFVMYTSVCKVIKATLVICLLSDTLMWLKHLCKKCRTENILVIRFWYVSSLDENLSADYTTLRKKQDAVMQSETVKRLEEEKIILLQEMETYLKSIERNIKDNTQKQDNATSIGARAVNAKHIDYLLHQRTTAIDIFQRLTDGDFMYLESDISPNENFDMLRNEYTSVDDVDYVDDIDTSDD